MKDDDFGGMDLTPDEMKFMAGGAAPPASNQMPSGPQGHMGGMTIPEAPSQGQGAQDHNEGDQFTDLFDSGMKSGDGATSAGYSDSANTDPSSDLGFDNFEEGSQDPGEGAEAPVQEFFDGGGDEYFDARDFIPEDLLDTEYPFHFDDEAKYRNWDDAVRGTKERLRYLKQVISERDQAIEEAQRLAAENASVLAERDNIQTIVTQGRSEEEVEMILARRFLPEEFQGIEPSSLQVSIDDYLTPWEDFYDNYKRKHPVNRGDYDSDAEFRSASFDLDNKAAEAFRRSQAKANSRYLEAMRENQSTSSRYNAALAEARSKVRAQMDDARRSAAAAQESEIRRLREAEASLKREVSKEALGLVNREDEFRAAQLLGADVSVFQGGEEQTRSLAQVMVAIRAQYGPQPVRLLVEGLKSELGVNSGSQSSKNPQPRKRQAPRARPSRLRGGGAQKRRRGPAPEPSPKELFAEAGFLAR